MTERKFYKTVIQVEVLSEEPLGDQATDLTDISYQISEGDCSGKVKVVSSAELNGKEAADALSEQGSDPGFFRLDDDGNDYDE